MRLGLIGCGIIGALRAEAIARLEGFRLTVVSDVASGRAQAVGDRFGALVDADWRRLVRRPDIDAVIVSTPPPLHAVMCIEALAAGKHVLCEKPLARSPEEGRPIVKAAEASGRLLATGFNYRFYPAIVKARAILDSGLIGELDHIRSYTGHPGGAEFSHSWVHEVDVMGGGALVDNGIHTIDLTRYFLGEVSEVKGFVTSNVWGFAGCEDNAFALLRSPVGKVASVQASWSEWRGYRWAIEIYGTRGCVRASYPPMLTQVVWVDRPGGRRRRRMHVFPVFQAIERLRSPQWTVRQSFMSELPAFARAIAGEKTEIALGRDGLCAVEIAHAAYRGSRDGATVTLNY